MLAPNAQPGHSRPACTAQVTAFIVERAFGGITSGPPEDKLGIRASQTCEVTFDNVRVPVENVLGGGDDGREGGRAGIGQGFMVAMNILNNGRFGIGAAAGAMGRKVMASCAEHALTRTQFGDKLSSFGLIQDKMTTMAVNSYSTESIAYMTTGMIDRGDPSCEVEAACCKVYGSEKGFESINDAIQIFGGMGFMKDFPFERMMRDCRILSIFEGTNEILRLMIALSGLKAAGDRLKSLGKLAANPLSDPLALLHEAGTRVENKLRPQPVESVHPRLQKYGNKLRVDTVAFGTAVEQLLVKHGKDVIHEQLQLRRVADCAIDLYICTAVLARASRALEAGTPTAEHEAELAAHACAGASLRVRQHLKEMGGFSESHDARVASIAAAVFESGGCVAPHPLGV